MQKTYLAHSGTYDELYHHGIKGMKWGIRRKRSSSSSGGSSNPHAVVSTSTSTSSSSSSSSGGHSTKKNTSTVKVTKQTKTKGTSVKQYSTEKPKSRRQLKKEAAAAAEKARKDELSRMSDKELRARINRLQMERQYEQLTATPKQTNAGAKFVKDILINAGKQTLTNYTAKYMAKGVDKLIEKAMEQATSGS